MQNFKKAAYVLDQPREARWAIFILTFVFDNPVSGFYRFKECPGLSVCDI